MIYDELCAKHGVVPDRDPDAHDQAMFQVQGAWLTAGCVRSGDPTPEEIIVATAPPKPTPRPDPGKPDPSLPPVRTPRTPGGPRRPKK